MRPGRVRERVLADHRALRRQLQDLERSARHACGQPEADASQLRGEAEALVTTLSEHMRWEDRFLEPALRQADAWGVERADLLAKDHREQRELLADVVAKLRDRGRPPRLVADNVLDLIALLREDMEEEEELLLDPRVLRDDPVGIDVETG
jgi:iron-sulfur cluster repair protein YtfE (RIC family)